jgi:hypothetical protein
VDKVKRALSNEQEVEQKFEEFPGGNCIVWRSSLWAGLRLITDLGFAFLALNQGHICSSSLMIIMLCPVINCPTLGAFPNFPALPAHEQGADHDNRAKDPSDYGEHEDDRQADEENHQGNGYAGAVAITDNRFLHWATTEFADGGNRHFCVS